MEKKQLKTQLLDFKKLRINKKEANSLNICCFMANKAFEPIVI